MFTPRQVVISGILVNYYFQESSKSDNALVFLHGWRSEGAVWLPVIKGWTDEPCPMYLLDLPGFGKSELGPKIIDLQSYCDLVAEFILKLDLKSVTLVGHSFGGRIGIKVAATRPDLIRKLILVDSAGFVNTSFRKKVFWLISKIIKPIFKLPFLKGLRQKLYRLIGAEDYIATPELRNIFVKVVGEDLQPHFPQVQAPTLIIWGAKDGETPLVHGQLMHEKIANSKLVILENAGHFSFLDQPRDFSRAVLNFLSDAP